MNRSVFTRIVDKEIPAEIIHEDDELIALRDIAPKAPVHILIVPKKQIPTLNDATTEDEALLGRIVLLASKLARQEGVAESGYRLVMNCNADAGQTVFHIHCHLLGGRALDWPPG